jgi:hypothetical protein
MTITTVSGQFASDTDRAALLAAIPSPLPVPDTLQQVRDKQWLRIAARRDLLTGTGGFKVSVSGVDKWFHSDDKSRTQQLGLLLKGANVPAIPWKTMDKSFVTMSQTLAQQIFDAAVASDTAIFGAAETIKANMLASTDPASFDITTGWPVTFSG